MSPQASMVARANLDWDYEVHFPRPNYDDGLTIGVGSGSGRYVSKGLGIDDTVSHQALIGSTGTVGTGTSVLAGDGAAGTPEGIAQHRLRATAPGDSQVIGLEGIAGVVPTMAGGIPIAAGAAYPSLCRVWWLRMLLRYKDEGGGNADNDIGIIVAPEDSMLQAWPTDIVGGNNRGGMGIVGDGAGDWIYRSFDRAGVGLVRESQVLQAHNIAGWNLAEWVIVGNRPGIAAVFEFWFNSVLIVSRNWAGALLEPMGGPPAANNHEWRWGVHARIEDAAALCFLGVMRAGRFLRDGTEIQG